MFRRLIVHLAFLSPSKFADDGENGPLSSILSSIPLSPFTSIVSPSFPEADVETCLDSHSHQPHSPPTSSCINQVQVTPRPISESPFLSKAPHDRVSLERQFTIRRRTTTTAAITGISCRRGSLSPRIRSSARSILIHNTQGWTPPLPGSDFVTTACPPTRPSRPRNTSRPPRQSARRTLQRRIRLTAVSSTLISRPCSAWIRRSRFSRTSSTMSPRRGQSRRRRRHLNLIEPTYQRTISRASRRKNFDQQECPKR